MTRFTITLLAFALFGAVMRAQAQVVRAGEYVSHLLETQHPYAKSGTTQAELTRTDVAAYPGATFISVHFDIFDLAPGDYVVIRSPDDPKGRVYSGLGRSALGRSADGFFAAHVKGDVALVELYTSGNENGYGYRIDFFGRGYSNEEIQELWDLGLGEELQLPEPTEATRSVCTADDTLEAKCYQASEAVAYDKSRAVARLLITKTTGQFWCTGWLLGCDGHVMTNEHCIEDQSQASNTDFEFMAEGADCGTNCASGGACDGTIEATGGTLIAQSISLDYTLVLPDTSTGTGTDLAATYGFMRFRDTGAILDERIYLPQHPAGWGKRIALESSYPDDADGFPHVNSITETPCSGGPGDVGYWADTRGGSSGTPVLGYQDHLVVALHHCRGANFCTSGNSGTDDLNRGVPIPAIIADLGGAIPNCAIGEDCVPGEPPTGLTANVNGDNNVELTWGANGGAITYNIYRGEGDCPGANYTLIATGLPATIYEDTTATVGNTFSYIVTSEDGSGCESNQSNCDSAMPTAIPPFGFDLWMNNNLFHPFYDANGNGIVEIADLAEYINDK